MINLIPVQKMVISLSVICIAVGFKVNAQNVTVDIATERSLMSKSTSAKIDAEGSPYITEEFEIIKIDKFEGQTFSGRYNAYNDEMEVKLSDDQVVALDNSGDYTVTFSSENKTYKTFKYMSEDGNSKQGFLVVLEEKDNFSLLKREQIKFYEKKKAASSYQQDKPATFRRDDDTYYLKLNDEITFVPQKKKVFLNTFSEHSADLKSYIKKNKINLNKEKDLIAVIDYLSTL